MLKNKINKYDGRKSARVFSRESVSIQIVLSCLDSEDAPRIITGETTDISCTGMRLLLTEPIAEGRVFDLCIEIDVNPRYFLLSGESRWCYYNEKAGCYETGILIHDNEGTDYQAWEVLFKDRAAQVI